MMKIKNKTLLTIISKLGYWRNGQKLEELTILNDGRFYIYKVGGVYLASEAFNWYLTRAILEKEVKRISCLSYLPRLGDTVVDVGAGLGEEITVYASLVGSTGTVHAIEANPVVYSALKEIVRLNQFANVKPANIAINSRNEVVEIDDAPSSYLASSLNNEVKGTVYKVKGCPFEQFCTDNNIQSIDFLKVNIEGAERFLDTAFATPNLQIHHTAISCHDFRFRGEGNEFFKTKQLVVNYLQANGYETWSQQTGEGYVDDWVYGKKRVD